MDFTRITYRSSDRRATITLNRPSRRNVLDDAMVTELTAAFTAAGRDPSVRIIFLQAPGAGFCTDVEPEYLSRVSGFDLERNREESLRLAQLLRLIYELRKPVIALVDGPALGGGVGLASACDFVIASRENAQFGCPEVRIGFLPAVVAVFLVKRVGEGRAREFLIRGHSIDSTEALRIGLASMVVPAARLSETAEALAHELTQNNSPNAMGLCKEMLSKLQGLNLPDALDFAANLNAAARMTVECRTGVGAFLRKEKLQW